MSGTPTVTPNSPKFTCPEGSALQIVPGQGEGVACCDKEGICTPAPKSAEAPAPTVAPDSKAAPAPAPAPTPPAAPKSSGAQVAPVAVPSEKLGAELARVPKGFVLAKVPSESVADQLGLRQGDVVLAIDAVRPTAIADLEQLTDAPASEEAEPKVLHISRNGEAIDLVLGPVGGLGARHAALRCSPDLKYILPTESGVVVGHVPADSNAHTDGFQEGDVVVSAGADINIVSPEQLDAHFKAGGKVEVLRPQASSLEVVLDDAARLGVTVAALDEQTAATLHLQSSQGIVVKDIGAESVSDGVLRKGDIIVSINGKPISSPNDVAKLLQEASEGLVKLEVIRYKPVTVDMVNHHQKGMYASQQAQEV